MVLWQKHAALKSILSCVGTDNVLRIEGGERNAIFRFVNRTEYRQDQCSRSGIVAARRAVQGVCKNHLSNVQPAGETQSQGHTSGTRQW